MAVLGMNIYAYDPYYTLVSVTGLDGFINVNAFKAGGVYSGVKSPIILATNPVPDTTFLSLPNCSVSLVPSAYITYTDILYV